MTEKRKYKNVQTDIVVAGRNYCNILTMARALGEAGYAPDVLRVYKKKASRMNPLQRMKPDACSKYINRFYECVASQCENAVVKQLTEIVNPEKKALLIPVDDYTACIVDEALDELTKYYIVPNVNRQQGKISLLMDKNEQKKLAKPFNLPVLEGALIKSEGGSFDIPEGLEYPCFVKPNISMNSTKAKMAKCSNEEELRSLLSAYAAAGDFEMLVEKFADIKAEYSLLGLSTEHGVAAPALFKALRGGHRERKGVAVTGEVVETDAFQEIIENCSKFVSSLNYCGIFDIDLIETKDGNVYFVEINFRAGASMYAFTKAGVNLAGMFADNLLKKVAFDNACSISKSGIQFVSEKVLLEEYIRGDISKADYKACINEADVCFVRNDADEKPYLHYERIEKYADLLRFAYRLKDAIKS